MNIVMVSYMDLTGPGVMHLYHFANELHRRGHRVLVLLNGDLSTVELMEQPPYFALERVRFSTTDLESSLIRKIETFTPDLVHIWTPRNVPARVGLAVKYHTGARMLIHYEDDEDYLYDFHQGNVLGDLAFFVNTLRVPNSWNWKHPVVSFLANHFADAFTAICPSYVDRLERQWGKKVFLLYPGVDLNRFHPSVKPVELGSDVNLAGNEVVLYSGSIGAFHQFDLMLHAFARVARHRPDAVLIHLGHNHIKEALDAQVRHLGLEKRVYFLGAVPHREIHHYLALADILVQSGRPNTFNEFRLPAKLPEYMAMGKPVITFSAGIGRELVDGVDVLKTSTGEPDELAEKIEQILNDPVLAQRLARGARRRAEHLFDWQRNTESLVAAYEQVLDAKAEPEVLPRIRPSIADEAFGPWWETRGSRQILVVATAGNHEATEHVQFLIVALASRGHQVHVALPEGVNPSTIDNVDPQAIHTWAPESLNWLVWQVDPEILIFDDWSTLAMLDMFIRRPVVLDLAAGWSESNSAPGDVLRALSKADFFLCLRDDQRHDFLSWAHYYGLAIPGDDVVALPLAEHALTSRRDWKGAEAISPGLTEPDDCDVIAPLDRFCRAPFVRRPSRLVTERQKTFGMLIDEAAMHYRRGGMPTLVKETLSFVGRKLRG